MGQQTEKFDVERIQRKIDYVFCDRRLLRRAFTLSSFDKDENNQTLEFFGDAVIEFLVSERIYDENKSEGDLTELRQKYVSDKALAPVSQKLGLDKFLIRGKNDDNNKKAIPSVYEALVAAIYLDGGMDEARKFVRATLPFDNKSPRNENYKGLLQELLQGRGQPRPEYRTRDSGNEQKHVFVSEVMASGATFKGAEAGRKNLAEQSAAKAAYLALKGVQA